MAGILAKTRSIHGVPTEAHVAFQKQHVFSPPGVVSLVHRFSQLLWPLFLRSLKENRDCPSLGKSGQRKSAPSSTDAHGRKIASESLWLKEGYFFAFALRNVKHEFVAY